MLLDDKAPGLTCTERLSCGAIVSFGASSAIRPISPPCWRTFRIVPLFGSWVRESWMQSDNHAVVKCVLVAEEIMDLTNLPEYISAIVAIIALFISCYQARLSNKQSLFNRRLNIWITVDKLMSVYVKNAKNLEHGDEPQMAIGLLFELLTNTTYLQSISTSINHVLDADPQLKLHLKLDEIARHGGKILLQRKERRRNSRIHRSLSIPFVFNVSVSDSI